MDKLLDWFVDIMVRLYLFFHPEVVEWIRLCDAAELDPFNPFPEEES